MRTTGACKRVRKSALGLSSNGDFHDLKCSRTASVRGVAASRAEAVREGCDEPLVLEESSCVLTILRARMALVFLTGVTMDNFRAFGHAEVSFPPAGLVLLAGANNTGKTAFLSALDVIAGDSGDLDSVRHAGADAPPQVKARFSLASSELDLLLSSSPRPEQLLRDKVLTSLEFVFAQDDTFSLFGHRELGLTEVRGDRPAIGPVTVAKLVIRSAGQTGVEFLQTLTSDVAPSTMGVSGHGLRLGGWASSCPLSLEWNRCHISFKTGVRGSTISGPCVLAPQGLRPSRVPRDLTRRATTCQRSSCTLQRTDALFSRSYAV